MLLGRIHTTTKFVSMKCRLKWVVGAVLISRLSAVAGNFPISFIENKGQWDPSIQFASPIPGGQMHIGAGTFTYYFLDQRQLEELHEQMHHEFREAYIPGDESTYVNGRKVSVSFVNHLSTVATPALRNQLYYNYFVGDASTWVSHAATYQEIDYEHLYEGVDLRLYGAGSQLKYDLVLRPGADPDQIRMHYDGAVGVKLLDGNLLVDGGVTYLTEQKPFAYQLVDGKRHEVVCAYRLIGNDVSFIFPDSYDPCLELIIDPLLIFSTYSGSTADNWGSTATPGESGTLYSAGVTNQSTFGGLFPVTPGAFQVDYGGLYDVGVLKYDSTDHTLLYASFLGGAESESPHSLLMNEQEELIVLGTTGSADFPTTPGTIDQSFNGGTFVHHVVAYGSGSDLFVAKISKDGGQLLASTLLGGTSNDGLNPPGGALEVNYGDPLRGDVIVDTEGNILISSVTSSSDFPVVNSFNTTFQGGSTDALVMKLNADLTQIIWGAYLGGSAEDAAHTIKLNSQGRVLVAGGTASSDFQQTPGTYQETFAGVVDGWVAELSPDGSSVNRSTFTGTNAFDQVYFLDVNSNDEVYVYGQTSGQFPVIGDVYKNANSGQFLQKFGTDLTTPVFSTVFGSGRGVPDISPTAFLVNECNNIYMTGWGGIVNQLTDNHWNNNTFAMPVSADAFQKSTSGSDFYFIVLTDNAKEFLYGTYMGGDLSRTHVDGGTSRFDKLGVVYHAVCAGCSAFNATGVATSDFPTTPSAWSDTNNSPNCNNAAFKFDLSSLKARIQTNSIALDHPGLRQVCFPDPIVFQNLSTGGEIYEWDFGDLTTDSKLDTSAIIHHYQKAGTYTVRLKAIDQGTCVGKDSTTTTVRVFQPSGVVGPDQTACFDQKIKLVAGGGVQYLWRSLSDSIVSEIAEPVLTLRDTTSYKVKVIDQNGCVVQDTVRVAVVPGVDLKFQYERLHDCNGRPWIELRNLTDPGEDVFFDFDDGQTSDLDEVTHRFEEDGTRSVRLVGRKEFCVYDETVELPFFTLKVPNVITPNEDGKNDAFKIVYGSGLVHDSGLRVTLTIFNRWGKQVLGSDNYQDNWNASDSPAGTYYYEANIEGETTCKGWVQVIK